MGNKKTGIEPFAPTMNLGITLAAKNSGQTDMKAANTALCFIKLSRSSDSGSAGLCFLWKKKIPILVTNTKADTHIHNQTRSSSLCRTPMWIVMYKAEAKTSKTPATFNHAPFCVLFMVITSPAVQNQGGQTLNTVKQDKAPHEDQEHDVH